MNYKVIDKTSYYRNGVYRHFTENCKCSVSMTATIDVTDLVAYSKQTGTKFYLNVLYLLAKVLNSRYDYRMGYLWQTDELICYDVIHPLQYVFHEETETCTPVYSEYCEIIIGFTNEPQRISRPQSRAEPIGWIWNTIRTGLMRPMFHGFRMMHCILNCRMAISILRRSLTGADIASRTADW